MGYQFYHMLLHTSKRAKDVGLTMMENSGMNPGQAWLLDVISRFGPVKQVEAASILNVKLPAVSRMVKGMQRDGLVK
ncbi:MAG: MarR family transcriptional regulator, partial [Spirochaetales bacterium]|nr:MarR family transcriptional regulator [Spirochaetales bacterium]